MPPRREADEAWSESEPSTDAESLFSNDNNAATDSDSDVESPSEDSPSEDDGRPRWEDDHLLSRVAFHKSQGRARPRRKNWSQSLVERELDFWCQYVLFFREIPFPPLDADRPSPLASARESSASRPRACVPARQKPSRRTLNGARRISG